MKAQGVGQAAAVASNDHVAPRHGTAHPGEMRRALVTQAADYDLAADLLDAHGRRDAPPDAPAPRRGAVHLPTIA